LGIARILELAVAVHELIERIEGEGNRELLWKRSEIA
jgi:hypothetical protein